MGNSNTRDRNPPPPRHAEELQHHRGDDGQEFTCEICIEPAPHPNKKFRNGDKCVHPFCTDCVIKYISVKLEDGHSGLIRCPALNCDHTLDPVACAPLIGRPLFSRWCDVLCEAAIMGWEMCHCPYRDCNVLILNECGGDLKKSRCPKCKRWFCFRCKTVWHRWLRCKERNGNDVTFRRLAARNRWKRCPTCRHFVELTGGCLIVRCRCGISFCYSCGERDDRCRCEPPPPCDEGLKLLAAFVFVAMVAAWCYVLLWSVDLSSKNN